MAALGRREYCPPLARQYHRRPDGLEAEQAMIRSWRPTGVWAGMRSRCTSGLRTRRRVHAGQADASTWLGVVDLGQWIKPPTWIETYAARTDANGVDRPV